ncbi:hypothetical protein [Actinomadura sp. K4S16]|uniref:hypothetical protein n=1 Tax=Actinomadura sp. K4S16 TaxID=1316147 RepID=UPI0011ED24B7|nr:hypothetical protein [Actinomadura sp. K4S16]
MAAAAPPAFTAAADADTYLRGPDGEPLVGETFSLRDHLAQVLAALPASWPAADRELATPDARRVVTRYDPLLFAYIYCRHLLKDAEGNVTWADTHLEFCRYALSWTRPAGLREQRHAFVAPRESAKSTWLFKLLPLWASAHGHIEFIAAFSSSGTQAHTHLAGYRNEIDNNQLLRTDYPLLCSPGRRPRGAVISDSSAMMYTASGFSFTARGLDSSILGLVDVQNRRPQLLLLDDVEPDESNYSLYQMGKRRTTIMDTILPMNERAHVVLVGTVTMPGSVVHQLVKTVLEPDAEEQADWIAEQNFQCHYFPPLAHRPDGTRRSIWPDKWPVSYLEGIEHTRSYRKNFANDPMAQDGAYWNEDDFTYSDPLATTRKILSVDGAVTDDRSSDYTGLAVVSYSPTAKRCWVERASMVKLLAEDLRRYVLTWLEDDPEIRGVLVETNQGGKMWLATFHHCPVPVKTVHQKAPKHVRAAWSLSHYQRGKVHHAARLRDAEHQMIAYPRGEHDDLVDAIGTGVLHFLGRPARRKAGVRLESPT